MIDILKDIADVLVGLEKGAQKIYGQYVVGYRVNLYTPIYRIDILREDIKNAREIEKIK